MINHGHFEADYRGFSETPAVPGAGGRGRGRGNGDAAYQFYKEWTGPGFPRMLMVIIQHANPYYDDSYAVNSENVGPYGDAINQELLPYLERRFRGVGQGWARGMFGGSTGGWETLATQIFYPDDYNGAWAACPDAVDFPRVRSDQYLRRKERVLLQWRLEEDTAPRRARSPRASRVRHGGGCALGVRARRQGPFWRSVGHLAGGVQSGRTGRLSKGDLGSNDRCDRPQSRGLLERALRPAEHPRARLGHARSRSSRASSTSTWAPWTRGT